MRKLVFILTFVVALLCIDACSDSPEKNVSRDELTLVYTAKDEGTIYERKWIYTTQEGCLVIDTLGYGPQNREVLVYDSCYRLVCMAGQASEAGCMNFVKVVYLRGDTVSHFVSGSLAVLEDSLEQIDSLNEKAGRHVDSQLVMLTRIVEKWSDYDKPYWQRFYLQRDKDGDVTAVYDPLTKKCIDAPRGYKIRYELKENNSFWVSDIDGGMVMLYFYVEPKAVRIKTGEAKIYDGYELVGTYAKDK